MNSTKIKVEFNSGGTHALDIEYALVEVSLGDMNGIFFPTEAHILRIKHRNDTLSEYDIEEKLRELAKESVLRKYLYYDPVKLSLN